MAHPIEGLMNTAMNNLKQMIDVNTIVGDPIATEGGGAILTVSKVCFGFASGGSQFGEKSGQDYPFGGGSGGGVSITPIAFLVVNNDDVQVMHLDNQTHTLEKLIDLAPQALEKVKAMYDKQGKNKAGGADSYEI